MIIIRRGQWKQVVIDGQITARMACPGCGMWFALDHTISEDGQVTPSLVCPMDCGFHDHVQLEGWE